MIFGHLLKLSLSATHTTLLDKTCIRHLEAHLFCLFKVLDMFCFFFKFMYHDHVMSIRTLYWLVF